MPKHPVASRLVQADKWLLVRTLGGLHRGAEWHPQANALLSHQIAACLLGLHSAFGAAAHNPWTEESKADAKTFIAYYQGTPTVVCDEYDHYHFGQLLFFNKMKFALFLFLYFFLYVC